MPSAMSLRGRKLPFEILNDTTTIESSNEDPGDKPFRKKKKHHKKKKHPADSSCGGVAIPQEISKSIENGNGFLPPAEVVVESVFGNASSELRQRNVNFGGTMMVETVTYSLVEESGTTTEESGVTQVSSLRRSESEANGTIPPAPKLETAESLDWRKLMADDPNYFFPVEASPVNYFMDGLVNGNSLRSTTIVGSEKERERVYDTIFRLPWRCELLIDVGFFVCLDSFLSLLTLMPTRILMTLHRALKTRQFKKPSAAELSDIGCFIVLVSGIALLQRTDISLIYHMIRGQGTIKLYVVYNVLEIFDRLCQSFGGDVLQTLFNSAEGLASSSPDNMTFWIWRFISDEALAMAFSILHSFILLVQAITLSTCIVAHNNALLALLVSNNFAEIKSSVFKRFSKDNIHSLVYADSVERFHISAFLLFVLAQNIREAEGPWFQSFLYNALLVFMCEVLIDIIKHSFLAKFNDIKPIVYSEFLEELCNQDAAVQPSLVIVYFGGNDSIIPSSGGISQHVPLLEYTENMRKIAIHLKSLSENTRIIFLSTPPVNEERLRELNCGSLIRTNKTSRMYSDACLNMCQEGGGESH